MRLIAAIAGALIFIAQTGSAALNDFEVKGYVKLLPMYWEQVSYDFPPLSQTSEWKFNNILHTRQNFRWYPHDNLTFALELKTRLFTGEEGSSLQESSDMLASPPTYFDWTRNFVEEDDATLTSSIDRARMELYLGDLQFTAGPQRIAWGTNLVWNPIDIFNPSSPLDMDDRANSESQLATSLALMNQQVSTAFCSASAILSHSV